MPSLSALVVSVFVAASLTSSAAAGSPGTPRKSASAAASSAPAKATNSERAKMGLLPRRTARSRVAYLDGAAAPGRTAVISPALHDQPLTPSIVGEEGEGGTAPADAGAPQPAGAGEPVASVPVADAGGAPAAGTAEVVAAQGGDPASPPAEAEQARQERPVVLARNDAVAHDATVSGPAAAEDVAAVEDPALGDRALDEEDDAGEAAPAGPAEDGAPPPPDDSASAPAEDADDFAPATDGDTDVSPVWERDGERGARDGDTDVSPVWDRGGERAAREGAAASAVMERVVGRRGEIVVRALGPGATVIGEQVVCSVGDLPVIASRRTVDGEVIQVVEDAWGTIEVRRDAVGRYLSARALAPHAGATD